ncbi:MAG: hercynine metabolism protein [Cyanobacteriota bacterium]|nr:hercynine metabolism protein [Cyanobacteriota bacterium]
MSNWLDQLERELDQRLSAFLRNNPVQEALFREQHQLDRARALQRQRQQLQAEAEEQRRQLLTLAEEVRAWTKRTQRARQANQPNLAQRAEKHLANLMEQGRNLWTDLADLGRRFQEVDEQLTLLKRRQSPSRSTLDADWAQFEAEQELDQLRRQAGLS